MTPKKAPPWTMEEFSTIIHALPSGQGRLGGCTERRSLLTGVYHVSLDGGSIFVGELEPMNERW